MDVNALPDPSPSLVAVVVVPARDEEALIGACVEALGAQRGVVPGSWEILLVLDGGTDATAARARETAARFPGLALHELHVEGLGAGGARAAGMDLACQRLELSDDAGAGGLIATTDADSRVAPDWLERQLAASAAGAAAIGGRIELDAAGASSLGVETIGGRERRHGDRLAALAGDGPTEHPFFGGASIAITARAYRAIGGMEPLAALEDEALAHRLRAAGIEIHRLDSVRVVTSARTDGRAAHGLARDLAVAEWSRRRTYDGSRFRVDDLLAAKRAPVSLILPAKEVASTIGRILDEVTPLLDAGLLDEIFVVDADSADGTGEIAASFAGATVVRESELNSRFGPPRGKGDAMWRAAAEASGDVLVFCDTDTSDFSRGFVLGLLGPILTEPAVRLVKGAFARPLRLGDELLHGEGGRVTELVAKPLLNLHFFDLAGLEQPLAGEIAIDRSLFGKLSVPVGYGVEIAMLIDALELVGLDAIAQTRLGSRQNRHQPLAALGAMAYEVIVAVQRRVGGAAVVPGPLLQPGPGAGRLTPRCEERPPLDSIGDAGARPAATRSGSPG